MLQQLNNMLLEKETFKPVIPLCTLPFGLECQLALTVATVYEGFCTKEDCWLSVFGNVHIGNKINQEVVDLGYLV